MKDLAAARCSERGSAMLVTMIITTALLSGAVVLVSLQLRSTRSAGMTKSKITSVHCSEAGLVAARATVARSYAQWNAALASGTEPSWLAGLDHDVDDDGTNDFTITLRDNHDEQPDDQTRDNDLSVYIVSTCTKHADTPTEITELVRYNGGGSCYDAQLGGCGGNSNAN